MHPKVLLQHAGCMQRLHGLEYGMKRIHMSWLKINSSNYLLPVGYVNMGPLLPAAGCWLLDEATNISVTPTTKSITSVGKRKASSQLYINKIRNDGQYATSWLIYLKE